MPTAAPAAAAPPAVMQPRGEQHNTTAVKPAVLSTNSAHMPLPLPPTRAVEPGAGAVSSAVSQPTSSNESVLAATTQSPATLRLVHYTMVRAAICYTRSVLSTATSMYTGMSNCCAGLCSYCTLEQRSCLHCSCSVGVTG
jgi:hypothetical protein